MKRVTIVVSALFIFFNSTIKAQYNFKGVVVSGDENIPLAGVTITSGNKPVAATDAKGEFQFNSATAKASISFSHIGYQPVSGVYMAGPALSIILYRSNAFLSEAVIKAFEQNSGIRSAPISISSLAKADLERYSNANLLQAVNTVPGVKMDERSPGSYRLSIRGNLLRSPFGVRNVKVYWNGIPFTDANGNTYINELGYNNVTKIEIIKGPGGSMYGAGTGGVVLLTGRNAGYRENSIAVNSLAGSYGLAETNITYQRGEANSNYMLQYAHQQSDGWRDLTSMRRDVANYTGSFDINKKQSISINIFHCDLYYQTPGGLTLAQMNANPQQARPASGPFKSAAEQQAALYLKTFYTGIAHEYQFNSKWSNTTSIYASSTKFKNPTIRNYERKTEIGVGERTVMQYHSNHVTLHFGGEYQYTFTSTRTFGNKSGAVDTLQYDDEIAANQLNLFVQGDINLMDDFIINAGFSYNNYHYGFTRLNKLPVTESKKTFDPVLVPRVSILKKITDRFRVYATVSRGYSPPSIDEVHPSDGNFNAALKAELAMNYEAGFRAEIIPATLFAEAVFYLFNLDNTIVARRDASGADYFVNTGKTDQKGIEISARYYPVRNAKWFVQELKLWSNYTYIHARFKDYQQGTADYSGNKLTGTPPNVFVLGADISTKPGLYAHFTYSFTDSIPLNDANAFFAKHYSLLMARLGFKKNISKVVQGEIYFSFDQSLNTPYSLGNDLDAAGNRFFNPSAPKNYSAGIKLKFNLR